MARPSIAENARFQFLTTCLSDGARAGVARVIDQAQLPAAAEARWFRLTRNVPSYNAPSRPLLIDAILRAWDMERDEHDNRATRQIKQMLTAIVTK